MCHLRLASTAHAEEGTERSSAPTDALKVVLPLAAMELGG
jgi:hypothetical protein